MNLTANWSYPTAIRFGNGRIAEIGEPCAQAGIGKPLLVTDRGLRDLPITVRTLDLMDEAGLGRAIFADVDPKAVDDAEIVVFAPVRLVRGKHATYVLARSENEAYALIDEAFQPAEFHDFL